MVLVQGRSGAFVCKNCQKVHKSHIAKIRKYILTWRNNREKILFCPLGASYFCRYTLFTCHWRRDPQIEFLGRQIVSHFAHFSYDSNWLSHRVVQNSTVIMIQKNSLVYVAHEEKSRRRVHFGMKIEQKWSTRGIEQDFLAILCRVIDWGSRLLSIWVIVRIS